MNEIDTHLIGAIRCYRGEYIPRRGDAPFALRHWLSIGSRSGDFERYVETFRGNARPMDDLLDFLFLTFGIERTELVQDAEDIFDVSFRGRFTELLRERKGRWTRPGEEGELDVRVRHDVEMYLGVLARRRAEPLRESGYDNWWVTTDGTAHTMRRIGAADGLRLPSSPCMHPDFLTNLLALGPQRRELQAKQLALLPVALHIQNVGWGVPALSEIADQIRRDSAGQPEYVIRRKLRDALDSLRVGRGREDHDFELDSALT